MWPDRVSNLGPLTYKSGALPTALRGPTVCMYVCIMYFEKTNMRTPFCMVKKRKCPSKGLFRRLIKDVAKTDGHVAAGITQSTHVN